MRRTKIGGCQIDVTSTEAALRLIRARVASSGPVLAVASVNMDHIYHFGSADHRGSSLNGDIQPSAGIEWLCLVDGVPVRLVASIRLQRKVDLIPGSDLLPRVLTELQRERLSVAFVGGSSDLAQNLRTLVVSDYEGLRFAGAWSPSRSVLTNPTESRRLAAAISRGQPDVLVVGLGKPLQEEWIQQHGQHCGAKVLLAFGAAAEFLVGQKRRSPLLLRKMGLEWMYRLAIEPRRLSRRYLIQGPRAALRLVSSTEWSAGGEIDLGCDKRGTLVDAAHPEEAQVLVVIVTFNSARTIGRLLESLCPVSDPKLQHVVCVDNGSTDGTRDAIKRWPSVMLIETGKNLGYAAAINVAIHQCRVANQDVIVLNPDLEVQTGAIDKLLSSIRGSSRIGVAFPLMVDQTGHVQPSIRREPTVLRALRDALLGRSKILTSWSEQVAVDNRYELLRSIDWATGAALAISSDCVDSVGEWDERYFLYSEEVDFCSRARRAGFLVVHQPAAVVAHEGGGSGSSTQLSALLEINKIRYAFTKGKVAGFAMYVIKVLGDSLRCYRPGGLRKLGLVVRYGRWPALIATLQTGVQK